MARSFLLVLLILCGAPPVAADIDSFAGRVITRIDLSGNRFTRDFIIRRELRSQVGKPLDSQLLQEDLRRLENLDIFSSVKVAPAADGAGVALALQVRELPFMVPYVSYDVTDEDGWSFGPALKSVNMLGVDLYVAGFALMGGKTSYLLDMSYPWVAGDHLSLDLDLARIERENELDGFRETSLEVSPWVGYYWGENGRVKLGGSYMKVTSDVDGHTLSASNVDRLRRAGIALGYDSRDVWGDPHRGWLNEVQVVKTGGVLGGEADFWTAHLDLRRFQPLFSPRTLVLAGLLSLQTGRVGRDAPEYLDFHLGGSNTIRGQNLADLGRVLYGKNQLIGTLEYRIPLLPIREYELLRLPADLGLAGAFFADAGLAWSEEEELNAGRARAGLGVGLRLLMPAVDMVRLDLGFDTDGNRRIHLAGFSKMQAQRLRLR